MSLVGDGSAKRVAQELASRRRIACRLIAALCRITRGHQMTNKKMIYAPPKLIKMTPDGGRQGRGDCWSGSGASFTGGPRTCDTGNNADGQSIAEIACGNGINAMDGQIDSCDLGFSPMF